METLKWTPELIRKLSVDAASLLVPSNEIRSKWTHYMLLAEHPCMCRTSANDYLNHAMNTYTAGRTEAGVWPVKTLVEARGLANMYTEIYAGKHLVQPHQLVNPVVIDLLKARPTNLTARLLFAKEFGPIPDEITTFDGIMEWLAPRCTIDLPPIPDDVLNARPGFTIPYCQTMTREGTCRYTSQLTQDAETTLPHSLCRQWLEDCDGHDSLRDMIQGYLEAEAERHFENADRAPRIVYTDYIPESMRLGDLEAYEVRDNVYSWIQNYYPDYLSKFYPDDEEEAIIDDEDNGDRDE